MRNVPPPLSAFVPPAAEYAATPSSAMPSVSTTNHFLIVALLFSPLEGGFLQGECLPVGIERIPDAERNGSQMLAVSKWQLVQDGHAQRVELALEHVLDRARPRPVRGLALVAPVAVLHVADDDSGDVVELPGETELGQESVQVV